MTLETADIKHNQSAVLIFVLIINILKAPQIEQPGQRIVLAQVGTLHFVSLAVADVNDEAFKANNTAVRVKDKLTLLPNPLGFAG